MQEHVSEGQTAPLGAEAGAVAGAVPSVGGRTQATTGQRPHEKTTGQRAQSHGNFVPVSEFARQIRRSASTVRDWCTTGRLGDLCMQQDGQWFVKPEARERVGELMGEAGPAPATTQARPTMRRQRGEPLRMVAGRLQIHPETLRTWCAEGRLGNACFKEPESGAWMITSEGIRSIQAGRIPTRITRGAEKKTEARGMMEKKTEAKKPTAGRAQRVATTARSRATFVPIEQFVQQVDWNKAIQRLCMTGAFGDACHKSPEGKWELKQSAIRQMSTGSLLMGGTGGTGGTTTRERGTRTTAARRTTPATRTAPATRTTARRAPVTPIGAARPSGQASRMVAGAPGGRTGTRQAAVGRGR